MISIRVRFADGNFLDTNFNGSLETAIGYYVGEFFNFGDTVECPEDNLVKAISVELI